MTSSCPPEEKLRRLLADRLSGAEAEAVEGHAQACAACQQTLRRLERRLPGPPQLPPITVDLPNETPAPGAPGDATIAPEVARGEPSALVEGLPADLTHHPRYRVTRLLGEGGMGAVYLAEHRLMGRLVALKVIHPQYTSNAGAVERFRREVHSAARLDHPHIVRAYDAEQAGQTHFLVMEYVKGTTLTEHLKQNGPLPAAEACSYARQTALGLQHAHENGMVHRDVKPDNLMLLSDGTVKILDFGLARLGLAADVTPDGLAPSGTGPGQLTAAGSAMGTPDYIAPEQATDAGAADIRADLYSLGCTLYQLLSGRVPFPDGSVLDKFVAHLERQPVPLTRLRAGLPPGLAGAVAKLMAKRPADRYQTPAEAAAALAPFATSPRKRRSALRLALVAVAGCVALGLVVFAARFAMSPAPKEDLPTSVPPAEPPFALPDPTELAARPSAADAFQRAALSPDALASAGGGDPSKAPAELVAVFGEPRWRLSGISGLPSWAPDGKRVAAPSGHDVRVFNAEGRLVRQLVGHTSTLIDTRFSSDGKRLATTGSDRTVRLWEVDTGRLRFCRGGFQNTTWGVAFSADGSALVVSSEDGTARVWDTSTGQGPVALRGAGRALFGVAFTPNGKTVVAGCADGRILFWSAKTGQLQRSLRHDVAAPADAPGHVAIALSPDGGQLATGTDKLVRLWDLVNDVPRPKWSGAAGAAGLLAFSPDGASLWTAAHYAKATPAGAAHVAVRWDARTGEERARLPLGTQGDWLAWRLSPDGKTLAGGSVTEDGFVRLVDTGTGKLRNRPAGHTAGVGSVAFSPDGKWLASAGNDRSVRVWDLTSGKERRHPTGHESSVLAASFSPDGRTLASGSWDQTVRLWGAESGALLATLPHPTPMNGLGFSPDSRRLATIGWDGKARIWDVGGRSIVRVTEGHGGHGGTEARFDRTGRRIATTGDDGTLRVWEARTERLERTFRGHRSPSGRGRVTGLAVLSDNRLLASSGDDGTVQLWPWEQDGPGTVVLRTGNTLRCVAAGPDGRLLAACGIDGNLYLCDRGSTARRQRAWRLFGMGGGYLHCVAFSPEGRYLATANPDGTVYLLRLAVRGKVPEVRELPDNMIEERSFEGHRALWVNGVALSADGKVAWTVGADKALRAWRVADGRQVRELPHPAPIQNVALAPNGKAAVTAGHDGRLRRWDLDGPGGPQTWEGHTARAEGLAWSPDGRLVVSGSFDTTVRVWEAVSGKPLKVLRGHAGEVFSVAIHKDSRRALSSGSEGTVRLWDLNTGATLKTWKYQPLSQCSPAVCFAPDGRRAAWGAGDGTVRVHDVEADRELLQLECGPLWTRALAFSPDGKRLLGGGFAGSTDGTLTLWDTSTGRRLDGVRLCGGVNGIAFAPDGRRVVSVADDARARVWRLSP